MTKTVALKVVDFGTCIHTRVSCYGYMLFFSRELYFIPRMVSVVGGWGIESLRVVPDAWRVPAAWMGLRNSKFGGTRWFMSTIALHCEMSPLIWHNSLWAEGDTHNRAFEMTPHHPLSDSLSPSWARINHSRISKAHIYSMGSRHAVCLYGIRRGRFNTTAEPSQRHGSTKNRYVYSWSNVRGITRK